MPKNPRTKKPTSLSRRRFLGYAGAAAATSVLAGKLGEAQNNPNEIVRAAIHPAIGVARVGNSVATAPNDFAKDLFADSFIGPELVDPAFHLPRNHTRDASGAIKRQAARFRIYGLNRQGQAVAELTPDNSTIEWSVQLANRKAQWYQFKTAIDLNDVKPTEGAKLSSPRRNPDSLDRSRLAIDGGLQKLLLGERRPDGRINPGRLVQGPSFQGTFEDTRPGQAPVSTPVFLGELRTDASGRLLVLGGRGRSESPRGMPVFDPRPTKEDTFNNADGWFDDISDGPVTATVTIHGQQKPLPIDPAWVLVAPPNYAPEIVGWRTLFDLVEAVSSPRQALEPTSFTLHILPLLARLSGLQWVNQGFADVFGHGSTRDFANTAFLARLNDPRETQLRREVFALFRTQAKLLLEAKDPKDPKGKKLWPMIYGDAFGSFDDHNENNLIVPERAAAHLQRWASGNFAPDFDARRRANLVNVSQLHVSEQPRMLDRAALEYCLADAFHPGCEVTWPMRHASIYSGPFRIKHRNGAEPDFGPALTRESIFGAPGRPVTDNPLQGQIPGGLTRWMALPWQGDTAFCRSGYEPEFDPFVPTFWAARVPNHVLTEEDYAILVGNLVNEQRAIQQGQPGAQFRDAAKQAFKTRKFWLRGFDGDPAQQMQKMIREFSLMGIIEARTDHLRRTPQGALIPDPDFPEAIFVESIPPAQAQALAAQAQAARARTRSFPASAAILSLEDELLRKAGWKSRKEFEQAKRLMFRRP